MTLLTPEQMFEWSKKTMEGICDELEIEEKTKNVLVNNAYNLACGIGSVKPKKLNHKKSEVKERLS